MKIFSMFEKLNKKNKLILISLAVFAVSLFLYTFLHFSVFLYVSGFFLALYIPGFAIKNILTPKESLLDNLFTAPVFTIFLFAPAYFGITKALDGQMNFVLAITLVIGIAILSILKTYQDADSKEDASYNKKYLFFGIGIFVLIHIISAFLYKLIPEIDGYPTLMKVENIVSSGFFDVTYRPLFSFLVSYIALISHIAPYFLFKLGMVLLQITGVYYLYQFTKKANITSSLGQYLVMISFIAIPIINVEIDYVRPQIIFIFALLPFIYYLSEGIEHQKRNLIFSTLIATVGLFFHEFFGILFLINAFFIAHYFYKKQDNKNQILFWALTGISTFVLLINIHHFSTLLLFLGSAEKFIQMIHEGLQWKWWFLGTYSNMDGNNLGWSGPMDIMKYYAYSLSPILALILFTYPVTLWNKIKQNKTICLAEKIALSILAIGLLFAELLPRINYPTLPDRFWPMISLSLLALVPFTFSRIKLIEKKFILYIVVTLLFIGISGSLYITKAKSGYISEREYIASLWIKNNTPRDALFITQGGNGPMIDYFAQRKSLSPFASFFLKEENQEWQSKILKSEQIYKNITILLNESLHNPSDDNLTSLNINLKKYSEEIKKENVIQNLRSPEFKLPDNKNIYVLYSLDKFNNYYGQRKWWRTANFFGADLNKFKEGYDLVYNDSDIIYIWKKK